MDLLVPGQFACFSRVHNAHTKNITCKQCTRQVFLSDALVQGLVTDLRCKVVVIFR